LKKSSGDLHAAVGGVGEVGDGAGEDDQPPVVGSGVIEQVVLQAQPQQLTLIELGGLRCGVAVVEGVGVALLSLLLSGAPEGVGAADQVTAVQVVVRVELIAGLGLLARVFADKLGDVELARCTGRTSARSWPCPLQARPAAGTLWRTRPDSRAATTERTGCVEG
jgi:hypothetical protein